MNPQKSRLLLPLLFMGVLMGALDLAVVGPALPAIQAEFGMTTRQLSVLFNGYVLCQMVGTPLIAKLADRIGARTAYILGIGMFAAGSLLLVIAQGPEMLNVGRALQGVGAGGIFPVAATVIGNTLPRKERGPALGILGTVFGAAFFLGPVLGGLLLPFGWRWLFLVNLPITLVLIAGAVRLLPTAGMNTPKELDLSGLVALSTMLGSLVIGLNNLDTTALLDSLPSRQVAPALLLAAVMVPVFWRIEKRAADPIIRPTLLNSRPVVTASLIGTGVGAIQSAGAFYPALAVAAIGVAETTASWMLLPGVAAATIASPIAGRLINVIGTRIIVTAGLSLVVVSVLIFGLAEMGIPVFIMASVIGNVGMGAVVGAPLRLVILDNTLPSERGAAQGLFSNFTSVGRLLGAAFIGAVAASVGGGARGYQAAFLGMAVVAAAMVTLGISLKPKAQEDEQAAVEETSAV